MKIIINNQKLNLTEANTFIKRLLGLMGKKKLTYGMIFPKTRSIHTFFMKVPIDIIMIDKNNQVVYYERNVKKNRIIIQKKAYHTIELPCNIIKTIKINDKIELL